MGRKIWTLFAALSISSLSDAYEHVTEKNDIKSSYYLDFQGTHIDILNYDDELFRVAGKNKKPILILFGQRNCYSCAKIAEKLQSDSEAANYIKENYNFVVFDKNIRFSLSRFYHNVAELFGHTHSIPTIVWLDEFGNPFHSFVFDDPQKFLEQFARLKKALVQKNKLLNENKKKILGQAELTATLARERIHGMWGDEYPSKVVFTETLNIVSKKYDPSYGGTTKTPKSPIGLPLRFLIELDSYSESKLSQEIVLTTLTHIGYGGVFDHISGGVFASSSDHKWFKPNFEKLLHEQAIILESFAMAYKIYDIDFFKYLGQATVEFIFTKLRGHNGGFVTGIGPNYRESTLEDNDFTWSYSEIKESLSQSELNHFLKIFYFDPLDPNKKQILRLRTKSASLFAVTSELESDEFISLRKKLRSLRKRESRLNKDHQVISLYNSILLSSLVKASAAFGDKNLEKEAISLAEYINHVFFKTKQIGSRFMQGKVSGKQAFCHDYAAYTRGLIDLFEKTGDIKWLNRAIKMAHDQEILYLDKNNGDFYFGSHLTDDKKYASKTPVDPLLPDCNALSALNYTRLHFWLGKPELRKKSDQILKRFSRLISGRPHAFETMLNSLFYRYFDKNVVIRISDNPATRNAKHLVEKGNQKELLFSSTQFEKLKKLANKERYPSLGKIIAGGGRLKCQQTECVITKKSKVD